MNMIYDRIAVRYDRMHSRWLAWAGGEAQAALEAVVRSRLQPGMRVLDAGCGTGEFARHLARTHKRLDMHLVDSSAEMLRQCKDLAARCVQSSMTTLPYENGLFDIVVAAWSIEATDDPDLAIAELVRVVKPGGMLIAAFCADEKAGWMGNILRTCVELRGTGRFLSRNRVLAAAQHAGVIDAMHYRLRGPAAVISFHKPNSVAAIQLAA